LRTLPSTAFRKNVLLADCRTASHHLRKKAPQRLEIQKKKKTISLFALTDGVKAFVEGASYLAPNIIGTNQKHLKHESTLFHLSHIQNRTTAHFGGVRETLPE
jgi:hypothetical protein